MTDSRDSMSPLLLNLALWCLSTTQGGGAALLLQRFHAVRMITLGLNVFHGDSAAALVCDGNPVAATEEEWFPRIKHWAGFPSESITSFNQDKLSLSGKYVCLDFGLR
jgi:hypothetical protein